MISGSHESKCSLDGSLIRITRLIKVLAKAVVSPEGMSMEESASHVARVVVSRMYFLAGVVFFLGGGL